LFKHSQVPASELVEVQGPFGGAIAGEKMVATPPSELPPLQIGSPGLGFDEPSTSGLGFRDPGVTVGSARNLDSAASPGEAEEEPATTLESFSTLAVFEDRGTCGAVRGAVAGAEYPPLSDPVKDFCP